jgi:hypothetical protein
VASPPSPPLGRLLLRSIPPRSVRTACKQTTWSPLTGTRSFPPPPLGLVWLWVVVRESAVLNACSVRWFVSARWPLYELVGEGRFDFDDVTAP